MTEEIIKSITNMEAEAEQIKAEALAKAAAILSVAEEEISQKERIALENQKKYKEEQYKNSLEEADVQYAKTLAEKERDAKLYCEKALQSSDAYVGAIVGRIISGNR